MSGAPIAQAMSRVSRPWRFRRMMYSGDFQYTMHPYYVEVPSPIRCFSASTLRGMLQWPGHLNAAHGTQMGENGCVRKCPKYYATNCGIGKVQGTTAGWKVMMMTLPILVLLWCKLTISISNKSRKLCIHCGWMTTPTSWEQLCKRGWNSCARASHTGSFPGRRGWRRWLVTGGGGGNDEIHDRCCYQCLLILVLIDYILNTMM